jgi:hypothetical protein
VVTIPLAVWGFKAGLEIPRLHRQIKVKQVVTGVQVAHCLLAVVVVVAVCPGY